MGEGDWVVDIGPCKCGSYRIGRQDEFGAVEPPALHRCETCSFEGSYAVHVDCPGCRAIRVDELADALDSFHRGQLFIKLVADAADFDAKMDRILADLQDSGMTVSFDTTPITDVPLHDRFSGVRPSFTVIDEVGQWEGGNTGPWLEVRGDRVVWSGTEKEWRPKT